PRFMKRELSNFLDAVALFEQPRSRLVAQVVEVQVLELEDMDCPSERRADRLGVVGEDQRAVDEAPTVLDDLPGIARHLEGAVVADLAAWMLHVAEQGGTALR